MNIGILGTGGVAQALADALNAAGHSVTFGSRTPQDKAGLRHPVGDTATVVQGTALLVNATSGGAILDIVGRLGAELFAGKTIIDVANGLTAEFALAYPNDSLGRRLQDAVPAARVVKALNTVNVAVMTNPGPLATTSVFVSGDDAAAKRQAAGLIRDLGWDADSVIDLGAITTARAAEHYALLFFALGQALQTRNVNIRVVTG